MQQYFRQIADILAFVNRQMILIFKTNDLLRAIEHSLGTGNSMNSFVQMSRACFRCLNNDRYRNCRYEKNTLNSPRKPKVNNKFEQSSNKF